MGRVVNLLEREGRLGVVGQERKVKVTTENERKGGVQNGWNF